MVSSPMYERLKIFMEAARTNRELDAWDTDHKKTLNGFEEANERLNSYRDKQGFEGEAAASAIRWVAESLQRISMVQSIYTAGHTSYEAGRSQMAAALKEAEMISPTLLDSATEAMRDNPVVMVPRSSPGGGIPVLSKRFTTGAAYVDAVEAQANAQREAAAQRVLSMVNQRTSHIAAIMRQQADLKDAVKHGANFSYSEDKQGTASPSADEDFGRAADRSPSSANYPGGFAQPWWSDADAAAARNRTVASGALPTQEPAYGETGSRTNPITDPQELMGTDLLHTPANGTAYRNGVLDGHTPAPPADAHHPLWRLNGGAASDSATAGRLGGAGVLGAGALGLRGAARMGSGSIGGTGSLGGSSVFGRFGGAGSSALGRFGGTGAGANGLGGWPVQCRSHGCRGHARRHRLDQRSGWRRCLCAQGRLLLGFRLRLLHASRRICGRGWRWWRERCRRFLRRHGHHGRERRRCCWRGRCCRQGRNGERRLHGSRRGCGRRFWQGRQEGPQAPVHGLQVRRRRRRAARGLRESSVADLRHRQGHHAGEA